jgi:hypothetical protein
MKKIPFLFVLLSFALSVPLGGLIQAQVIVAPTILYLSDHDKFGTFVVMNRSRDAQEILVSFKFGYPTSDSLGNIFMRYDDSIAANKFSCANWLRGFPRQFILNPGQQQTVRLTVTPPAGLPDGVYWTRLITRSTPQLKFVDTVKTGVTANITFVLEQVTTIIFEKGKIYTSISVSDGRTFSDSSHLNILAKLSRGGDAPFFGTASLKILNDSGNTVYTDKLLLAAYFDMDVKFAVPLSDLRAGDHYTAVIDFSSDRPDIPPENEIRIEPVEQKIPFTISEK